MFDVLCPKTLGVICLSFLNKYWFSIFCVHAIHKTFLLVLGASIVVQDWTLACGYAEDARDVIDISGLMTYLLVCGSSSKCTR